MRQAVILNDVHFPYEHKEYYSKTLKAVDKIKDLAHIYLNGDIGEFSSVSSHAMTLTEPRPDLSAELNYVNKKLEELHDRYPGVPVTLIEGNHCYRFFRYIRDVAPQMWGVTNLPTLLGFDKRKGWRFIEYAPLQIQQCLNSRLYMRHEPLGGGKLHAQNTAEKSAVDLCYGHTHQMQTGSHKKFGPKPFITRAYALPWLGDKKRRVFDYRGCNDNWVEGYTVVDVYSNGDYRLESIPFGLGR